jgi:pyruvate ferredoxin oxidoreductase gamma subunit
MGAPVMAFCRIDDREIRLREPVTAPDALIIQDTTLLHQVDLFNGLKANGIVLFNAKPGADALHLAATAAAGRPWRVYACPASELAQQYVGRAVPNVPLLGTFAAVTRQIKLESVIAAIHEKFPPALAAKNAAAATEAFAAAGKALEASHA